MHDISHENRAPFLIILCIFFNNFFCASGFAIGTKSATSTTTSSSSFFFPFFAFFDGFFSGQSYCFQLGKRSRKAHTRAPSTASASTLSIETSPASSSSPTSFSFLFSFFSDLSFAIVVDYVFGLWCGFW